MKKQIEVMVKLPSNYFDLDEINFLSEFIGNASRRFENTLIDKAVNKALEDIELPKIKITPQEIKDKMLLILAEGALKKDIE